jgi:hypothetical protein
LINQGVFTNITKEETATITRITYFAFTDKQERALIYNPSALPASVSYSGRSYRNILTGLTIENPLQMAAYSSLIGNRDIVKRSSSPTTMNESFAAVPNISSKLTFAPNPVYNSLSINYPGNADPMTVTLFDITGKRLTAPASFTANYQLEFSNLQKGAYVVLVTNSNSGIQERRVIIKR